MGSVIDTNVFIGACLGTDAASSVVRGCSQGEVQPLMAVALMAEHEDVLARDELMAACRVSCGARGELEFPGLRCLDPADFLKEISV